MTIRTSTKPTIRGNVLILPPKRRALDWDAYFSRRRFESSIKLHRVAAERIYRRNRRWWLRAPLDHWKDLLSYHLIENYGGFCPKRLRMSGSLFLAKLCRARRSSALAGNAVLRS